MNARNLFRIAFVALVAGLAPTAWALIPTVATPVINPAGGSFVDFVDITITTTTPGATIYYTLDGTMPTTASDVYFPGLEIYDSAVLEAIAVAPGFADSAVASASFVITPIPTPTIHLRGKKSIRTTKASIKLKGTATDADSVEYTTDDVDYKTAHGTAAWSFKAKLKPGKNVFTIYAIGTDEDSDPLTVTVRRVTK